MNFTASLHPEPLAAACNFTKAKPHRGENRYQAVNSLSATYLQTHMQNFFIRMTWNIGECQTEGKNRGCLLSRLILPMPESRSSVGPCRHDGIFCNRNHLQQRPKLSRILYASIRPLKHSGDGPHDVQHVIGTPHEVGHRPI